MKKRLIRYGLTFFVFSLLVFIAYNAPVLMQPKSTNEQIELGKDLDKILEGFKND